MAVGADKIAGTAGDKPTSSGFLPPEQAAIKLYVEGQRKRLSNEQTDFAAMSTKEQTAQIQMAAADDTDAPKANKASVQYDMWVSKSTAMPVPN